MICYNIQGNGTSICHYSACAGMTERAISVLCDGIRKYAFALT